MRPCGSAWTAAKRLLSLTGRIRFVLLTPRHTMRKADPEGLIRKAWKPPKGFPKGFYLILKLGDYCSGWLSGETCETFRPYPTQEQWDKFQAEAKIAWPRFGARYALL